MTAPEGCGVSEESLARLLAERKQADERVLGYHCALERVQTAASLIEDDEVRELIHHLASFEPD